MVDVVENEPLIDAASSYGGRVGHALKTSKAEAGFIYIVTYEKAPQYATWFFERLIDGANLRDDEPVKLLRDRIIRQAAAKGHLEPSQLRALYIKAWNATVRGKTLRKLTYTNVGPKAQEYPSFEFPDDDADEVVA